MNLIIGGIIVIALLYGCTELAHVHDDQQAEYPYQTDPEN
jgi:hypothetical protein